MKFEFLLTFFTAQFV